MQKQIARIEGEFGPITLISETAGLASEDLACLFPGQQATVCDCHIRGIEHGEVHSWGYSKPNLNVVDHHAPVTRWETAISSGNLAVRWIAERGASDSAVINHTDCDSAISSGIVTGLLPPKPEYEAAVIAADHTGDENQIADLLQAIQDKRDLEFSFSCLAKLESGTSLPEEAIHLLEERRQQRTVAKQLIESNLHMRGHLACIVADEKVESDLFLPVLKGAWALALVFPSDAHPGRNELKLRLTSEAPPGLSLQRLDIKSVDASYGGRWNAGSNKRGGCSARSREDLFDGIAIQFSLFSSWSKGGAI